MNPMLMHSISFVLNAKRSFLLGLLVFGSSGTSLAQRPLTSGLVAQRVEALRKQQTEFKPVSLFALVPPSRETNALWNNGCRTAEVLRFDRSAARQLLADESRYIALSIPSKLGTLVVDLYRADVVTDDFTVRIASTGGVVRPSRSAHYRGSIRGIPGSIVAVSVYPEEVMALMSDSSGERTLGPFDNAPPDLLVFYHERDLLGTPNTG